jgi:hypothetical protein
VRRVELLRRPEGRRGLGTLFVWSAHDVRAAAAGRKRLWLPKRGASPSNTSVQANDDPVLKLVVYEAV